MADDGPVVKSQTDLAAGAECTPSVTSEDQLEKDEQGPDDILDKDSGVPMTLEEIEACDLLEMAKDKFKSRLLQRSLLRGGPEVSDSIFKKAEPFFMDLVQDQYGNYLSQKILEASNAEQFDRLFVRLKDHLKDLAQEVHGTRAVQKVVEQAVSKGKVAELLEALPAEEVEGLLERLCGTPEKALALGLDQWGCCVLKKCVDRAEGPARQRIVDAIVRNTLSLVQDAFGNYVVQHLIVMGPPRPNPNVTRVVDSLRGRMYELSLQKFSSNVLEKCLVNSSDKDRNKIINEILNPPNRLPSEAVRVLLFHQYGNYVFQQALEVSKDPQFSLLVEHSKQHLHDIIRAQSSEVPQPTGNLTAEHARRLAMKLVKKYPRLSEGLEMEAASMMGANSWSRFYDPYQVGFGFDASCGPWGGAQMSASSVYGYPFASWDASFGGYQPIAYPPLRGTGPKGSRGGGSASRAWSQGTHRPAEGADRGPRSKRAADGGRGGGQTVRVGRIVGFWPNYTITYDEVPAQGANGGQSRSRKKEAKGKAMPKKAGTAH